MSSVTHVNGENAADPPASNGAQPTNLGDNVNPGSPTTPVKRDVEDDSSLIDGRANKRRKGIAPIKEEYLLQGDDPVTATNDGAANDDAAEAFHHVDRKPAGNNTRRREKQSGQNKNRKFEAIQDEVGLCSTRVHAPEFSPEPCPFGEKCKFEHDLRKYLNKYKAPDLTVFQGICPVWEATGKCDAGWKCRFVGSHSKEMKRPNGAEELVLIEDPSKVTQFKSSTQNVIDTQDRMRLTKKQFATPKSDVYLKYLDQVAQRPEEQGKPEAPKTKYKPDHSRNSSSPEPDNRSTYVEPPLLPSEKRRLYFGAETPVLAPLTTQGNLPFRRLCVSLGASFTYSEMAMSLPLLQGSRPEWALIKAHSTELEPPTFTSKTDPSPHSTSSHQNRTNIVYDYNQAKDLKFSAQISASKPWTAIRAAEVLTTLLPHGLRAIDLNCGCPIDLVYREGAGSALMNSPNKLSKIIQGMNAVSGPVPITCKIRMGTKDNHPTAGKLIERLVLGSRGGNSPPSGVAAITLHGRSRQQRYTRQADWDYIAQTSELIKHLNETRELENGGQLPPPTAETSLISSLHDRQSELADTIHAPDPRDLAHHASSKSTHDPTSVPPVFFIGNGDIYSPHHYQTDLERTSCHSLMLARGALIKPWLFAEITSPSPSITDPRSTERLSLISRFVQFGLEHWGSDTRGVSTTRRFLLDWLSFTHRYVPVGLLEYLPPELNHRPPRFRARDELEQLLASDRVQDWLKISEMFLGPVEPGFHFVPKHKSNAYEEAEG